MPDPIDDLSDSYYDNLPDPDPDAEPWEEPEGWQALTAAERNPSMCRP